jgi:integrase
VSVTDREAMPTEDAIKMLAAATTLPHGSTWAAAFLQGLRPSERRGLTWDAIGADTFTVSWQLQALPYNVTRDRSSGFRIPDGFEHRQVAGALHLTRPKTKAGMRVYPLVPWMRDALDHWRAIAPPDPPGGLVWPMAANDKADVAEWQWLQDTTNVRHPSGRYYHRHEARHTTATLLLELDVPESVRVAIMGHSTIASTRAYEHVRDPQVLQALTGIAGRLQLTPPTRG